jgi:hypothetical protein
MLCNLAVRLAHAGSCMLRVSGRTVLGPSGTGGRDVKCYPAANALLSELKAFGLGPDVVSAAACVMSAPEARNRFINFADNVQISFEILEAAGIYLFD